MSQPEQVEERTFNGFIDGWSWIPKAGQRTIESDGFQLLYGFYFGALTGLFMKSADAANGGLHGISYSLVVVAIFAGFGTSKYLSQIATNNYLSHFLDSSRLRIFLGAIAAGISFILVLSLGITLPFEFHYGPGTWRPPVIGVLLYSFATMAIFAGLSQRISPEPCSEDEYQTERFQAYFDNKFRMFQAYLSVAIAAVVGVFLPISTIMIERQNLILGPLVWFAGGLFISLVVLVAQLQVVKLYVEKAYDQNSG